MRLLSVFLIACASGTAQQSSDFTQTGDLQMKVTFDQASSQVMVSFAQELEANQALFLNVRRGDLRSADLKKLDCSLVAQNPIATFGQLPSPAHGDRTVYQLKVTDLSLLNTAYRDADLPSGQTWEDGTLTPEKQVLLDRGIDTFVDICITTSGAVLRREQAEFFRAWDDNTPVPLTQTFNHNQPAAQSPFTYAEICVEALGEIPFFKNKRQVGADPVTGKPQYTYDTWDCQDSVHIPVTVTDAQNNVTMPDWDYTTTGSNKCDHPQWIYDMCEQGPRVISAKNNQGTHWVLLCRKGVGNTPPHDNLSDKYNDMAMVGYNPLNGRTCFFQNALYSKTDGAHVPHPGDAQKTTNLWSGVQGAENSINCIQCHDNGDAFILSPWIQGAKRDDWHKRAQTMMSGDGANGWVKDVEMDGSPVVPMMGVHPDRPLGIKNPPYTLVNYQAQGWTHPRTLVSDAVKACTQCHVMGAANTMRMWAPRSVGLDTSFNNVVTDAYKNDYTRSHFMPLDPRPGAMSVLPAEAQWSSSAFATAVAFIQHCSSTSAADCVYADLPRAPPDNTGPTGCVPVNPGDCDF